MDKEENMYDDNQIKVSVFMYFIDGLNACSSQKQPENDSAVEGQTTEAKRLQNVADTSR
jgi:hypothetical protein